MSLTSLSSNSININKTDSINKVSEKKQEETPKNIAIATKTSVTKDSLKTSELATGKASQNISLPKEELKEFYDYQKKDGEVTLNVIKVPKSEYDSRMAKIDAYNKTAANETGMIAAATVGGIAAGAGLMLSKTKYGIVLGAPVMLAGLLSKDIIAGNTDKIKSGAKAFALPMVAIGGATGAMVLANKAVSNLSKVPTGSLTNLISKNPKTAVAAIGLGVTAALVTPSLIKGNTKPLGSVIGAGGSMASIGLAAAAGIALHKAGASKLAVGLVAGAIGGVGVYTSLKAAHALGSK